MSMVLGQVSELAQVPKGTSIIASWQQAGMPRDPEWLQVVGPALEVRGHHQNAIVAYCWLEDAPRVLACLSQIDPAETAPELLRSVLFFFLRQTHWQGLACAIASHLTPCRDPETRDLSYDLAKRLARSPLSPTDLTREQRLDYLDFMRERVLSASDWSQTLPTSHAGILLEKIGSLSEALAFYSNFVNSPETRLRRLARTRWLAVRKKQAIYCRKEDKLPKAVEIEKEVRERAREWQMKLAEVQLKIPVASSRNAQGWDTDPGGGDLLGLEAVFAEEAEESGDRPEVLAEHLVERGPGTKIELPSGVGGVFAFEVQHIRIEVMSGKQILIVDTLAKEKLQIDGQTLQLRFGTIAVNASNSESLSFGDVSGSYNGTFYHQSEPPKLHLNVQGVADPIVLTL